MWRPNTHIFLRVRADGDCDDTHAVVARPKWAREHGLHTRCVDGLRVWPIDRCSDKDVATLNVRPRIFVETSREKTEAKTKTVRKRQSPRAAAAAEAQRFFLAASWLWTLFRRAPRIRQPLARCPGRLRRTRNSNSYWEMASGNVPYSWLDTSTAHEEAFEEFHIIST